MKFRIIWVGKSQEEWIKTSSEEYKGRVARYFPIEITEIKDERHAEPEASAAREGERILKAVSPSSTLFILDEQGIELTSKDFASMISKEAMKGSNELTFVIGGAYGLSEKVREKGVKISLSKMTFTHQMVRTFFLEQLYRACTIMNNEKYHH